MRRFLLSASSLGIAGLVLYSCTMHAAVTTDGRGHVTSVSALRIETSFSRLAVAMLVAGGRLALELRLSTGWGRASAL